MTVGAYLRHARSQLVRRLQRPRPSILAPNEPLIILVMGNDAGDLDSVVSALASAYLLTQYGFGQRPSRDLAIDPAHDPWTHPPPEQPLLAVPIVQTDRQNAKLRPENVLFLETVLGEQDQALLWLDEVLALLCGDDPATTWRLGADNNVRFALVDHNRLTATWGAARSVYAIIDHHADEGVHSEAYLRLVEGPTSPQSAGSCASLVALVWSGEVVEQLDAANPALASIGALLLGPILVDTDALRPAPSGKATQCDEVAVNLLFPHAAQSTPATEDPSRRAQPGWSLLAWDLLASGGIQKGTLPQSQVEPVATATKRRGPGAELSLDAEIKALRLGWKRLKQAKASAAWLLTSAELLRRDCKVVTFDRVHVGHSHSHSHNHSRSARSLSVVLATLPTSVPLLVYDRFNLFPADPEVHTAAWEQWWGTLAAFAAEKQAQIVLGLCSSRVAVPPADGDGNATENRVLPYVEAADTGSKKERESKHIRDLIAVAVGGSRAEAQDVLAALTNPLEAADRADPRLGLHTPWSYPLPDATRAQVTTWLAGRPTDSVAFDHVAGLGADATAGLLGGSAVAARVYRQLNAKANRKVVLPAVADALHGQPA